MGFGEVATKPREVATIIPGVATISRRVATISKEVATIIISLRLSESGSHFFEEIFILAFDIDVT